MESVPNAGTKTLGKKGGDGMPRSQRDRIRLILEEAKGEFCLDCGGSFPSFVLQFDHVRGIKKFTLSVDQASRKSMKAVREEIEKCDVVCANCHLIRTHEATFFGEKGGWIEGRKAR
jgi:hypothetical protein